MRIEQTPLKDCFIIHEKVHGDARGYFIETFNQRDFKAASGLDIQFVQDNQSRSSTPMTATIWRLIAMPLSITIQVLAYRPHLQELGP